MGPIEGLNPISAMDLINETLPQYSEEAREIFLSTLGMARDRVRQQREEEGQQINVRTSDGTIPIDDYFNYWDGTDNLFPSSNVQVNLVAPGVAEVSSYTEIPLGQSSACVLRCSNYISSEPKEEKGKETLKGQCPCYSSWTF